MTDRNKAPEAPAELSEAQLDAAAGGTDQLQSHGVAIPPQSFDNLETPAPAPKHG